MSEVLNIIGQKARDWAGHYTPHSDGWNTFLMFAEWVESAPELKAALAVPGALNHSKGVLESVESSPSPAAGGREELEPAWPISTDGPHEISFRRMWLARQLMDSRLDEETAIGIVAHHPAISGRVSPSPAPAGPGWRLVPEEPTPEMRLAMASTQLPALFRSGLDPLPGDGPATRRQMVETVAAMDRVYRAALAASPAAQGGR